MGSHDLYEHPHINDLAYVPPLKDLRFRFNFLVGGLFSPMRRAEAVPLDAWVSADDVLPVCSPNLQSSFRGLHRSWLQREQAKNKNDVVVD